MSAFLIHRSRHHLPVAISAALVLVTLLSSAAHAAEPMRAASWSVPSAAEVKAQLDPWLEAQSLDDAKKEFEIRSQEFGITAIEEIKDTANGQSFLLSDLDQNWVGNCLSEVRAACLQKPAQYLKDPLFHRGAMMATHPGGCQNSGTIGQIPPVAFDEHLIVRVAGSPSQLRACFGDVKVDGSTVHRCVISA